MAKTVEEKREYYRKRSKARTAAGLCGSCARKALEGTTRCEVHTKKVSGVNKGKYDKLKAAGVCPLCKDETVPVVDGKSCCQPCLDKQAMASAERRAELGDAYNDDRKEQRDGWKALGLCIHCGDEPADPGRVLGARCRAKANKRAKKYSDARRLAVVTHYGAVCKCCGETRFKFLEIDHVNNDGAAHRREVGVGHVYKWLIKHHYPEGFQVLCSSCNQAKGRYGKCPHEDERYNVVVYFEPGQKRHKWTSGATTKAEAETAAITWRVRPGVDGAFVVLVAG